MERQEEEQTPVDLDEPTTLLVNAEAQVGEDASLPTENNVSLDEADVEMKDAAEEVPPKEDEGGIAEDTHVQSNAELADTVVATEGPTDTDVQQSNGEPTNDSEEVNQMEVEEKSEGGGEEH